MLWHRTWAWGTIQMSGSDPSSWAGAPGVGEPPSQEGFSALMSGVRAGVTLHRGSVRQPRAWRGTLGEQGGTPPHTHTLETCNALVSEVTCIISTRLYYSHKPTMTRAGDKDLPFQSIPWALESDWAWVWSPVPLSLFCVWLLTRCLASLDPKLP